MTTQSAIDYYIKEVAVRNAKLQFDILIHKRQQDRLKTLKKSKKYVT